MLLETENKAQWQDAPTGTILIDVNFEVPMALSAEITDLFIRRHVVW
jgi:hypothetical protein